MTRKTLLFSALILFCASFPVQATENYEIKSFNDPVFKIPIQIKQKSKDKGQSMLLVHGLGTQGSKSWDLISDELAKHYHIISFDLPGFGESKGPLRAKATPEAYSELIMRIVTAYGKSKIIYVGHSMGAAIGLRFVSQYSHLVDKAVLMNAAGILEKAAYLKFLTRMQKDTKLKSFFAGLSNIVMDILVEVFDRFSSEEIMKSIMDKNTDAGIAMNLIQTDFTPDIQNIRTKTLIIWGEEDVTAPLRTGHMLNYHLMHSKLVIIPKAGHIPLIKQPQKVAKISLDWLADPESEEVTFPEVGDREFNCKNKELKQPLTGSYGSMTFKECSNVRLQNLSARHIQLVGSVATFENVKIVSGKLGLVAEESSLVATNLVIEAPTGISTQGSKLDVAGVIIKFESEALKGSSSLIYWSTSFHTQNDQPTRAVHGKQVLN